MDGSYKLMGNIFGSGKLIRQDEVEDLHLQDPGCMRSTYIRISDGVEDNDVNAKKISKYIERDKCRKIVIEGNNPIILDRILMCNLEVEFVHIGVTCLENLKARKPNRDLGLINASMIINDGYELVEEHLLPAIKNLGDYCLANKTTATLHINATVRSDLFVNILNQTHGRDVQLVFHGCVIDNAEQLREISDAWLVRSANEMDVIDLRWFFHGGKAIKNDRLAGWQFKYIRENCNISAATHGLCAEEFKKIQGQETLTIQDGSSDKKNT